MRLCPSHEVEPEQRLLHAACLIGVEGVADLEAHAPRHTRTYGEQHGSLGLAGLVHLGRDLGADAVLEGAEPLPDGRVDLRLAARLGVDV